MPSSRREGRPARHQATSSAGHGHRPGGGVEASAPGTDHQAASPAATGARHPACGAHATNSTGHGHRPGGRVDASAASSQGRCRVARHRSPRSQPSRHGGHGSRPAGHTPPARPATGTGLAVGSKRRRPAHRVGAASPGTDHQAASPAATGARQPASGAHATGSASTGARHPASGAQGTSSASTGTGTGLVARSPLKNSSKTWAQEIFATAAVLDSKAPEISPPLPCPPGHAGRWFGRYRLRRQIAQRATRPVQPTARRSRRRQLPPLALRHPAMQVRKVRKCGNPASMRVCGRSAVREAVREVRKAWRPSVRLAPPTAGALALTTQPPYAESCNSLPPGSESPLPTRAQEGPAAVGACQQAGRCNRCALSPRAEFTRVHHARKRSDYRGHGVRITPVRRGAEGPMRYTSSLCRRACRCPW